MPGITLPLAPLEETGMKPKRVPQQSAGLAERQWTQKLQEQARTWQLAKSDGHYLSDQGVPVVRRQKRSSTKRSAARCSSSRPSLG